MKITCPKSGITYTSPIFSRATVNQVHPAFSMSQRQLALLVGDHQLGKLSTEESILLFLAVADSTSLVEWQAPFKMTPDAASIAYVNMGKLVSAVTRINVIKTPSFHVPHYCVSNRGDANTMAGFMKALSTWEECIEDFERGTRHAAHASEVMRIESSLERLLRIAERKPEAYARALSHWTRVAAQFPTHIVDRLGSQQTCADYWQYLIQRMIKKQPMGGIPEDDLTDILEFCEEEIPHGSIFAAALMGHIREALRKERFFLGMPLYNNVKAFAVLGLDYTEEATVKKDMARLEGIAGELTADSERPLRNSYSSGFSFLQALAKWESLQELKKLQTLKPQAPEGDSK